jgi:hypothetical protein
VPAKTPAPQVIPPTPASQRITLARRSDSASDAPLSARHSPQQHSPITLQPRKPSRNFGSLI